VSCIDVLVKQEALLGRDDSSNAFLLKRGFLADDAKTTGISGDLKRTRGVFQELVNENI